MHAEVTNEKVKEICIIYSWKFHCFRNTFMTLTNKFYLFSMSSSTGFTLSIEGLLDAVGSGGGREAKNRRSNLNERGV